MGDQEKPKRFSIDAPTKKAIARITRREHCGCSKADPVLHSESQNDNVPGWQKTLSWMATLAESGAEVLEPSSIPYEEWIDVITLPSSIESLTTVKALRLYRSHLRRIPPEIGRMHSLRELDIYTSYSLHWLPYELTRCRQLRKSRMSTRAMFGNRKTHLAFPRLGASRANSASDVRNAAAKKTASLYEAKRMHELGGLAAHRRAEQLNGDEEAMRPWRMRGP
ncbi:MAG: hypothetical protein AB8H86_20535 [Polyangiales bacterium]